MGELGHPERRLPPVIHVAGTNGKGSTTAFLRAMLEAAGKRVHVYTSPHLVRFHERIRLAAPGGGRFVDEDELADALLEVERVNAGAPITQFEITTAAAFPLFADHPADITPPRGRPRRPARCDQRHRRSARRGDHPDLDRPREIPRRQASAPSPRRKPAS